MVKNGFRIGNKSVTYTDTSLTKKFNVKFNLCNNKCPTNQATNETSGTSGNNAYSLCRQSPINITIPKFTITPPSGFLDIKYKNDILQTERSDTDGHVSFVTTNSDYITSYNGRDFKLLQYHFHIDSEHEISGNKFKAEVHFVHKDVKINEYLVIAIFLEDNTTSGLNVFDDAIYETGITNKNTTVSIDMSKLSDVFSKDYFTYAGSLTTDPFNADVTWVIFKHPSGINSNKAGHASNAGTPRSVQHNINPAEVLCFNSGVV